MINENFDNIQDLKKKSGFRRTICTGVFVMIIIEGGVEVNIRVSSPIY